MRILLFWFNGFLLVLNFLFNTIYNFQFNVNNRIGKSNLRCFLVLLVLGNQVLHI